MIEDSAARMIAVIMLRRMFAWHCKNWEVACHAARFSQHIYGLYLAETPGPVRVVADDQVLMEMTRWTIAFRARCAPRLQLSLAFVTWLAVTTQRSGPLLSTSLQGCVDDIGDIHTQILARTTLTCGPT